MERKGNEFLKTKADRSFGSAWVGELSSYEMVPVHELVDGNWVETPEYRELMKRKKVT